MITLLKTSTQDYTIQEIKTLLKNNSLEKPKAKYSNDILLAMADNISQEKKVAVCCGRGGFLDRGKLCEVLLKHLFSNTEKTWLQERGADLKRQPKFYEKLKDFGLLSRLSYEVKFSTSYANGTPATNSRTKYVIVISNYGASLVEKKLLSVNKSNKVLPYQPYGEPIELLNEMLGIGE